MLKRCFRFFVYHLANRRHLELFVRHQRSCHKIKHQHTTCHKEARQDPRRNTGPSEISMATRALRCTFRSPLSKAVAKDSNQINVLRCSHDIYAFLAPFNPLAANSVSSAISSTFVISNASILSLPPQ